MITCDVPERSDLILVSLFFLGRMFIFYGNKTSTQFLNFTPTVICSDDLQSNILKCSSMCPCVCSYLFFVVYAAQNVNKAAGSRHGDL